MIEKSLNPLTSLIESTHKSNGKSNTIETTPAQSSPSTNTSRRLLMLSPTNDSFYEIPDAILREAEEGCRSRRNFAGRLASILFSTEEMARSNYRGVNGKNALDKQRQELLEEPV